MSELFARLFSARYMVKPDLQRGELPSSKDAYAQMRTIAIPAILEMVSIAVISMADMAMVGRLGSYAVAAVGLTTQPRMMFMSFFFAVNIAVTAIVSRRKGQDDRKSARLCLKQGILVDAGLIIALSMLQVFLAPWLMRLAGGQGGALSGATTYFRIMGMGLLFPAFSTLICSAQRAVGNTKITMAVNLTANLVNVLFNYLLIEGNLGFPRLEVAGAAIATVIGQGVGFVLALISMRHRDNYVHISLRSSWKPHREMLKSLKKLAGGALLEQLSIRIGLFTFAAIVASLGTDNFAAHQIAMQLLSLSYTFADGIAVASTTLVGQNLGKQRPDLSILYGKIGQKLALMTGLVLCAVSILGRYVFASLFSNEAHIVALSANIIVILGLVQPFQTWQIVLAGSLRGAGDTKYVALTMLLTVVLIRPLGGLLLLHGFHTGVVGAWYVILADQTTRFIMLLTRFNHGKWAQIKV